MKKTTILILMLVGWSMAVKAQCINNQLYPMDDVASNNSGDPQRIDTCVFTSNYSIITNLTVGNDYIFTMASNGEPVIKYITITDVGNNPLASGPSPLTVSGIQNSSVRVHYSEDNTCASGEMCLESYITAILTCPFPTNIEISEITTTHASFSWMTGGSEGGWEVMVLPKGTAAPAPSDSGVVITGNSEYEVDNLEAGHRYQFYIRADCDSEFSPWRGPYNFNADCAPITVFSENFDGVTDNELPACWTALTVNASSEAYINISTLSNSEPNAVELGNGNSAPAADIMLISPNLSTVGTASHRLKFYTRGFGNVSIEVGTIDATTSVGNFTPIQTINANSNYTEHIVNFTNYSGSDTFVAFRHANTNMYSPVFIDDIRWEMAPLCPDITAIETTAISQTAASLAWQPGGSETQWDVVYSDTSNDPLTLTPITPAPTEPEATISGLQPNTSYKVWIRSSCGNTLGDGVWSDPVTFSTACNPVNTFSESFDTTATGSIPGCWTAIVAGNDMFNSYIKVDDGNASSGTNAISISDGDGVNGSKIILVSPSLNTVATATHRVKFYAKGNVPVTLEVGTMNSAATGADFTLFETINLSSNYAEYVVNFATYQGSDNYIAFKHSSGQFTTISLDDIRWEQTPQCADVTEINVINITPATVTVDWTANADETQWDVVYGTANVTDPNTLTPLTPMPATNSDTTLQGLTPNTVYKVWVRSACGGTQGNGAWIGPVVFRTACLPTAAFNEGFESAPIGGLPDCWSAVLSGPTLGQYAAVRTVNNDAAFGNNAVEMHANSSEPTDWIMLISPYLNTLATGTHRLKFYALSYNSNTPLEIGTMNGNTSQAAYTLFQPITLGSGYNEYVIDFTTYAGTDTFIAFRNVAGNFNSTFIDNVRWELKPSCPDVTNLQAGEISTSGATITWQSASVESNWQVAYATVSVSDPADLTPSALLTDTTYTIDDVADNSVYNVWVRSVCGGPNGNGAWIGPVSFRTKCLAASVPYTEDFESVSLPSLPYCVSRQTISGNAWETTYGDSGYGFDGYVLRYQNDSSAANSWFFTQGVQLSADTQYIISYKYGNNSSDTYVERMQVLYGTTPEASAMLNEIADHTEINTGTAATNTFMFTPPATGDYYFGFLAYSNANQSQLFLDNISITTALSVPDTGKGNLSFYPNPVKDRLHLLHTNAIDSVKVINLLGQSVLESLPHSKETSLDLSALPTGAYIVRITAEGISKTIKIVKQ